MPNFGSQPPYLPVSFQKIETEAATACIDPSLPPPASAAFRAFFFAYYQQQAIMHATWLAVVCEIQSLRRACFPNSSPTHHLLLQWYREEGKKPAGKLCRLPCCSETIPLSRFHHRPKFPKEKCSLSLKYGGRGGWSNNCFSFVVFSHDLTH